jgi:hypothetical protein
MWALVPRRNEIHMCVHNVYAYSYIGFKSSLELVLYLFDSFRL